MFTPAQLSQYFTHISFTFSLPASHSLAYLSELQKYHLATVPFENLTLHYSKHHLLSLDPQDLFKKIVGRRMGGYCMEINAFFGTVLRSLGFTVYSTGGRVKPDKEYLGWSHMVNIVTIENQRYLVDVAFGADGPSRPLPLIHGHESPGIFPQLYRLTYTLLPQHTDNSQRIWVYSYRQSDGPWTDAYSFTEVEFFPADYEVMNLSTMTAPQSFFVQVVLCVKTLLNKDSKDAEGVLTLFQNEVKRRIGETKEVVETLRSETDRVRALEKWFGIVLTEEERRGIVGLVTELKG